MLPVWAARKETSRDYRRDADTTIVRSLTVTFIGAKGHAAVKRALEVAAAGDHNMILIGPPGSGKTMMARRLPCHLALSLKMRLLAILLNNHPARSSESIRNISCSFVSLQVVGQLCLRYRLAFIEVEPNIGAQVYTLVSPESRRVMETSNRPHR